MSCVLFFKIGFSIYNCSIIANFFSPPFHQNVFTDMHLINFLVMILKSASSIGLSGTKVPSHILQLSLCKYAHTYWQCLPFIVWMKSNVNIVLPRKSHVFIRMDLYLYTARASGIFKVFFCVFKCLSTYHHGRNNSANLENVFLFILLCENVIFITDRTVVDYPSPAFVHCGAGFILILSLHVIGVHFRASHGLLSTAFSGIQYEHKLGEFHKAL